jgi:hypothetical protein
VVDTDTFLTALYVMMDDFCQSRPPKRLCPGPDASLSPSRVITLAIFARWSGFASEHDFYRRAAGRLRDAFPTLPDRSQFDRLVRHYLVLSRLSLCVWWRSWVSETSLRSSRQLGYVRPGGQAPRGGMDDRLRRHRMEQPPGMVRGFSPARRGQPSGGGDGLLLLCRLLYRSAGGRDLLRRAASTGACLVPSEGRASSARPYVTDKGFEGAENHEQRLDLYRVWVIHSPKQSKPLDQQKPERRVAAPSRRSSSGSICWRPSARNPQSIILLRKTI